jgi:hypothetical protein
MKTTITILIAALALHVNILLAGNDGTSMHSTNTTTSKSSIELAPGTPLEATSEDVAVPFEASMLAPVNPGVATFDDIAGDDGLMKLAPAMPAVADFEEIN